MDIAHIIKQICYKNTKFQGIMKKLDCKSAQQEIAKVFNLLHTAPGPDKDWQDVLSPKGCMVVSIIQQLLVRLLIKQLMNIMTIESIILNRSKIPRSYLEHYLNNQAHFSLKEVIANAFYSEAKNRYVS